MSEENIRIIKKYPNRRLYDTEDSKYITLARVLEFIRQGVDFKVIDSQKGNDVTRSVLVQIIVEQENGESPLFTNEMLQKFICYCDDATRNVFSEFLESNFQVFADQQKFFQDQTGQFVGNKAMESMTNMAQQNMDMWQKMQENFMSGVANPPKKDKD